MENSVSSTTASAILNILASITISSPDSDSIGGSDQQYDHQPPLSIPRNRPSLFMHGRYLNHRHNNNRHTTTASKSSFPKRRLSSSSDSSSRSIPDSSSNGSGTATSIRLRHGRKSKKLLGISGRNDHKFCDPFDREQMIKRIDTFNILNWTIDDKRLTPLECAANGWRCHSRRKNVLRCQGCHASILVNLNSAGTPNASSTSDNALSMLSNFMFESDLEEEKEEAEFCQALVTSYLNRLHTDHYAGCVWKADNLDMSLVKHQYYIGMAAMDRILPIFDHSLTELLRYQSLILSLKNFKHDIISPEDTEILKRYSHGRYNMSIMLIAFMGWELRQQQFQKKVLLLLHCPNCTRRILLGEVPSNQMTLAGIKRLGRCHYPPSMASINNSTFEMIASGESADEFGENDIDLVKEHERWCCMVGRYSSSDLPGYKMVVQMLRSNMSPELDSEGDVIVPEAQDQGNFQDTIAKINSI